ncbi:MAG: hypothetical protein HGA75_17950, partial [Thiobacillus sp.]|nr:hypothetical protein [Thiobacillus sp.]
MRGENPDDYRHRMVVNVVAFVFVIGLIAAGLWLADTMAAMRKNLLSVDKPDSTAIILNAVEGIIEKKAPVREKDIQVFYLQAVEEEKNLELPFPSTTVGNTFLAD